MAARRKKRAPAKKKAPALTKAGKPRRSPSGTRRPQVDDSNWRVKMQRAHRCKFDDQAKQRYLQAMVDEGRQWYACDAAGITKSTAERHLANDPEFADAVEAAINEHRSKRLKTIETQGLEGHLQIRKVGEDVVEEKRVFETPIRVKMLEKYDPDYRSRTELEVTGKTGVVVIPGVVTLGDWTQLVQQHDQRHAKAQNPDAADESPAEKPAK